MAPVLTPYGGVGEIGGNKLLLESGQSRVFLDFGTSFATQGRFFHQYLNPRNLNGVGDWVRMGLAPGLPGLYRQDFRQRLGRRPEDRGVDAVVLSHAHLDHAGLMPLLRPDIPFVMSRGAKLILQMLQDTGGEEYLSYFEEFRVRPNQKNGWSKLTRADEGPRPRPVVEATNGDAGDFRIHAHSVDHSLPGAQGYIIESDGASVAYTGDFRFHGRHGEWSERFVDRFGGVDVLIIEGTNMGVEAGSGRTHDPQDPLPEAEVARRLAEAIQASPGFVAANYPSRDLDRLLSFWEGARSAGRRLLLTTKQAYLLDLFRRDGAEVPPLTDPNIGIYLPRKGGGWIDDADAKARMPNLWRGDYQAWERPYLEHPNAYTASDVRAEPRAFVVFVDLFNMTELVDLDQASGIYLYSKTEPFNEEMDIDYERLKNWVDHFGLTLVKAHASGHASREELEHLIDRARPRRIVPVHTHNVRAFEEHVPGRVVRLQPGQPLTL